MPPKGWKKPVEETDVNEVPLSSTEVQDRANAEMAALIKKAESHPVPGARKSLASHLDDEARGRIGAVNDVQIMCRSGLGRFDFPALWLKEYPDAIPGGHLTPRLRDAIKAAGEIWINCKTRKMRDGKVSEETLDHSRHAALWLKEFV